MEWYTNLKGRQVIIVRWVFSVIGLIGFIIGGLYLAILILGFWGYLEVSDMWNNNDKKRTLDELEDDVNYDNKVNEIVGS